MRKNILAGFILLMSLSAGIEAQDLDQDCNPLVLPPECRRLLATINDLDDGIAVFQKRLRNAGPTMKALLLRNIKRLVTQQEAVRAEVTRCKREHGATPRPLAPSELTTSFTGTATMQTTDKNAAGPFDVDLDLDFRFTRNRCGFTITRFPTLKLRTEDLPIVGRITVEVTRIGGGVGIFHPISGTMTLPITLHLHYDTALLSDDDATFNLTTGNSLSRDRRFNVTGSPLTEGGSITLVGTTRFRNGYLAGQSGSLVITANISPQP